MIVGFLTSVLIPIAGFIAACMLVRYKGNYTNCLVTNFNDKVYPEFVKNPIIPLASCQYNKFLKVDQTTIEADIQVASSDEADNSTDDSSNETAAENSTLSGD